MRGEFHRAIHQQFPNYANIQHLPKEMSGSGQQSHKCHFVLNFQVGQNPPRLCKLICVMWKNFEIFIECLTSWRANQRESCFLYTTSFEQKAKKHVKTSYCNAITLWVKKWWCLAYAWRVTLIYLQESASPFLIFCKHHWPSTVFLSPCECFCRPNWWWFPFSNLWLTFINLLSRKSNKTLNWPDGTSLKKNVVDTRTTFPSDLVINTRCRLRVCSLVWLVTDSTHAHTMKIS